MFDHLVMSRHERVFSYIQSQLRSGDLQPGTQLPGERKLAKELNVSRETVRQGLKLAEESGIIVRLPTLGTFVAPPQVSQDLGEMVSFGSTIRQLSLDPVYESVSVSHVVLAADQAARLDVSVGSPALRVTAVGVGNSLPLAYYESLLPERVFSKLPDSPPWNSEASYQIAAKALTVTNLMAHQEFESIGVPSSTATLLQVEAGAPAFRTVTLFSSDAVPLELRTALYPGSRYRFKIARHVQL